MVQGGGYMWRSVVTCVIGSLYIAVLFSVCVLSAKKAFWQAAVIAVPLPIAITTFWCASLATTTLLELATQEGHELR